MKTPSSETAIQALRTDSPNYLGQLLGGRLHKWRLAAGYPLKRLAAELGVSITVLSQWENGRRFPSQRHFAGLCRFTRVPPRCFLCTVPWPCARMPSWPAD
jgi:transcriptional regulator with XRE-family HTH domain